LTAKKTILILCDWFLPGYLAGGPIQSIATLSKQLGHDVHFKIITTDRDFRSGKPYSNVTINEWTSFEGRTVFYVSPENMNADFVLNLIQNTSHDTLYLNSLFSKLFTIYPLKWKQQGKINSRIVLAPRGMLRDGALAVKPVKKQLFLLYAKFTGLFKHVHWQATSAEESAEIKKRIGANVRLSEVSNLPAMAGEIKAIEKKAGSLKLCFIARMVEIKNLNFAIEVLKEIKEATVIFDVYGPREDEAYWELCENNSKTLPANITFTYKSVLKPEEIGAAISRYHALLLPTQTENFGHIIAETFSNGRPVVISDQTPWRGLEAKKAGFDVALNNKAKFAEAVKQLAALDQEGFDEMSKHCEAYIHSKLNLAEIKQAYLTLFGA
jgi:glycosyltransferase involved in cell wall biosynthesis